MGRKLKYDGATPAIRRKQNHDAWKARFIARDPEGYKQYMRDSQLRDRQKYGEKRAAKARERYADRKRCATLQQKYGITEVQFESMLAAQGGCAICKAHEAGGRFNRFHVDHNHKTGEVRGLLCDACNRGIGLLRESPAILRAAADYLVKFDK